MSTINEDRPKAEYGCAKQDLYTVATTVRQSLLDHLAEFTDHNTAFDAGYATLLGTRIATARNLPDDSARKAVHALLHTELQELGVLCIVKWQQLETAIGLSYDAEDVPQRLLEAGKDYYKDAYDEDWEAMKGLLTAALNFVANNAAALTAGGLPAGYAAALGTLRTDFETKYEAFVQAEEATLSQTDAKISANNAVFRQVMEICATGRKVFRLDAALREQFIFESVLALITGGVAKHSIQGTVTDKSSGAPLAFAAVAVSRIGLDGVAEPVTTVKTDDVGQYKIPGLRNGKYALKVEAAGHVPTDRTVTVLDGPLTEDFALDRL